MALDKTALKNAIKNGFTAAQAEGNKDTASDAIASAIADAIDAFVKTGAVSFTAGSVTGTCPPNGPLTAGTATGGTIS